MCVSVKVITVAIIYFTSGLFAKSAPNHYLTKKPEWLRTCHKKDPEFVKCSTNAVQMLFDNIVTGIPEIRLPPTDPLSIERIHIVQGEGPVSMNASLTNAQIYGFGKAKILYNNVDPNNYDFLTRLYLPVIRIEGTYDVIGRVLLLPIQGHGPCWFQPKNVSIEVKSDVDLYKKDNYHFYNVTGVHVDFQIGDLKMYIDNLFGGYKSLSQTTNQFLNENWQAAYDALSPVLKDTIEGILFVILQTVFHRIPAEFFVEDIAEKY